MIKLSIILSNCRLINNRIFYNLHLKKEVILLGFFEWFKTPRVKRLEAEINYLKSLVTPEHQQKEKLIEEIRELERIKEVKEHNVSELGNTIQDLLHQVDLLNQQIREKENQLIVLDRELLLQEFGLYEPIYDFSTSEEYKANLDLIRKEQKKMVSDNTAVSFSENWTVNGSLTKGRKMTRGHIKQILRTFNNECDYIVSKVTFNNIENSRKRIEKTFEELNKMNETNLVAIQPPYLSLKIKELQLAYEYKLKKQIEKEEKKRQKAVIREQEKVEKEIEAKRQNVEKDKAHYEKALANVQQQLENSSLSDTQKQALLEKESELIFELNEIIKNLADLDYRKENQRAGYVYIISNIGAFGENVYKIGMSRRLNPQERIAELSGASVPFPFDVHAMIFSHDAPGLEAALHRTFEDKRVNLLNRYKEFFYVTLDEIEAAVKKNFDRSVSFTYIPDAEEFRKTQIKRIQMSKM